jgi:two-component system response regulator
MNDEPITFLLVEDSEHDILAFKRAWSENGIANRLMVVHDGPECLDYLLRRGRFDDQDGTPLPRLILLNNRMPKMEGLEVLDHIRGEATLADIPVILFTAAESDLKEMRSYRLGANAYIVKPPHYDDLSRMVRCINDFWELVEIPEVTP